MDKISLTGWMLVLVAAVSVEAAPQFRHMYLGYESPFEFLQSLSHDVGQFSSQPFRYKRSTMGPMGYNYGPTAHPAPAHHPMSFSHSFGYNPMFYPFKMFSFPTMKFPEMPKFPEMKFPSMAMPKFQFPSYSFNTPSNNFFNSGFKPYQPAVSAPAPHHPFGDHFMKMMGFHGTSHPTSYNHNINNNNNNNLHPSHGSYNNPKGNNYQMTYSKSSSMKMDYNNGKGHMVTKDSSYMNDNGKVYQHSSPEQHFTSYGNGKFVPDHSFNHH